MSIFALSSTESLILAGVVDSLSVLCDIIIVEALSYYLHSKRTGFKRTNSMIDRLIVYAVNRGVLTIICQTSHLIVFLAFPGRFIFFVFAILGGKLYVNTFLATLNAQKSMRGQCHDDVVELGTQVIDHINTSTVGTGTVAFRHATTGQRFDSMGDCLPTFQLNICPEKIKPEDSIHMEPSFD
ncbi:hypothetical protein V8D89_005116 [Ganoderma adspersum]